MPDKPPLLVIAGPTGVGKTAAAVALAVRLPIEVVSADSRQVYRGMDVATGKPTADERRAVRHHLVDVVDPGDRYDAARFARDARAAIAAIREGGRLPVVVGGTGLYIRALLRGLDPATPADPTFRAELTEIAARDGRAALHARLAALAPALARRLHPNDHVRVIRALELVRAGSPVGDAQTRWCDGAAEWDVVYVGLTLSRSVLAERLRRRAERMVAAGLEEEGRIGWDSAWTAAAAAATRWGACESARCWRRCGGPSSVASTSRNRWRSWRGSRWPRGRRWASASSRSGRRRRRRSTSAAAKRTRWGGARAPPAP